MGRLHDAAMDGRTDLVREYHGDGVNEKDACGKYLVIFDFDYSNEKVLLQQGKNNLAV